MDKIKLFFMQSCTSSRKARKYLEDNEIDFEEIYMSRKSLTWEQFIEILTYTENGVDDIISKRSFPYKELSDDGVKFDELTLTELYSVIEQHPKILRSPIIVSKNSMLIGYHDTEIAQFNTRENRKRMFFETLDRIRANENQKYLHSNLI